MDLDHVRKYCLSFAGTREQIQWENHLLFKVADKMFLIYALDMESHNRISLKCSPEKFEEMIEVENIIPAPYMARNKWITIQNGCRLKISELNQLIKESYDLVFAKLPKKIRLGINAN